MDAGSFGTRAERNHLELVVPADGTGAAILMRMETSVRPQFLLALC